MIDSTDARIKALAMPKTKMKTIAGTRAQCVARIIAACAESVFRIGDELIAAKIAMRGRFEEMVERDLPFGIRTAQMHMKISADHRLRKANLGSL